MTEQTATMTITPAMLAKVQFVQAHALDYLDAGWDVVIETQTEGDIAQVIAQAIGRARTVTGAVNEVRRNVVAPWVARLVETREGTDQDEVLTIARRLHDEFTANWWDATARLEGRSNDDHKPPRRELMLLGVEAPAAPAELTADLYEMTDAQMNEAVKQAEDNAPKVRRAAQGSGRQAPSTQTTARKPRASRSKAALAAKDAE